MRWTRRAPRPVRLEQDPEPRFPAARTGLGASVPALALLTVLAAPSVPAATWHVRADGTGDVPTIQEAILASADGDTVLLAPGRYTGSGNVNVGFLGRSIALRSEAGAPTTILDCQGSVKNPVRGLVLDENETSATLIDGITIENAVGPTPPGANCFGAAILIDGQGTAPTVGDCIFSNSVCPGGVVAMLNGAGGRFERCLFADNEGRHLLLDERLGNGPQSCMLRTVGSRMADASAPVARSCRRRLLDVSSSPTRAPSRHSRVRSRSSRASSATTAFSR